MKIDSLSLGFKTHVGLKRETNQDSFAVLRRSELDDKLDALLVVADGMGGVGGGEVASSIVAQSLPAAVREYLTARNGAETQVDTASLLEDVIIRANHRVRAEQATRTDLRAMGTTCVAALVQDGRLTIGNVGDSRAYLLRAGQLSQITEDHSEVWQLVKAGQMTREQARTNRFRNLITQAIGTRDEVEPDVEVMPLEEGDTVLLCSDGLSSEVRDAEIAHILASIADPQEICEDLVEAALRNGGSDNVTVVVARYGEFTPIEDKSADAWLEPAQVRRNNHFQAEAADDPQFLVAGTAASAPSTALTPGVLAVMVLLLLAALIEGVALFYLLQQRNHAPTVTPPVVIAPPMTEPQLAYSRRPITLLSRPLQDSILLADAAGNLTVADEKGRLLRLSPTGKIEALPGPILPLGRGEPRSIVFMTLDSKGNRLQTNLVTKSIDKYERGGARNAASIGRGSLRAPGALAVDDKGDIYVIDDHRLKEIKATPSVDPALGASPAPAPSVGPNHPGNE